MSKFIKRLSKVGKNIDTALVVGEDFVPLEDLLNNFNTVFVVADDHPNIKARNLVYRNFKSSLDALPAISVFFIQEKYNSSIANYLPLLTKSKATLVIWNSDKLDREKIKPLLNYKYKRVSKEHDYHFWKSTV